MYVGEENSLDANSSAAAEVNSTKAFSEIASKANMIPETDCLDGCSLVPSLKMPPSWHQSSQMQ